jgi:hypothetical protein
LQAFPKRVNSGPPCAYLSVQAATNLVIATVFCALMISNFIAEARSLYPFKGREVTKYCIREAFEENVCSGPVSTPVTYLAFPFLLICIFKHL